MLPILPLLFPVLWVLATACGEARVLAQMSKASPSSLVRCSKTARGQWQVGMDSGFSMLGPWESLRGFRYFLLPSRFQARPRCGSHPWGVGIP